MKKLFAVALVAFAVPVFANAGEAKAADKSAKKPAEKPADHPAAAADAGTAAPAKK